MAVIKVRVSGTREECSLAAERLREIGSVREVSTFFANTRRGESQLGRVYVEIEISPVGKVD